MKSILYAMIPLTLLGCKDNNHENKSYEKYYAQETDEMLNKSGTTKVLSISLSPDHIGNKHELRFYDIDGDGKTVEQFVGVYLRGGLWMPISDGIDLVRKDSKPIFNSGNNPSYRRIMTDEEVKRLDNQYQTLTDLIKVNSLKEKK